MIASMAPIRVAHVITGLEIGGAEMMLHNLLAETDRLEFSPVVISLTGRGALGDSIAALGVPVHAIGMRGRAGDVLAVPRLARALRGARPDVVQTWMYVANVVAGVVARLQRVPVVWGIHQSTIASDGNSLPTRAAARMGALLSRVVPRRILYVSEEATEAHRAMGYSAKSMVVVHNGIDVTRFRPDPVARRAVRDELGVAGGDVLIGLVARFHPQKDHETFLRAALDVATARRQVHFVLCGDGIDPTNQSLMRHITGTSLEGRVHLLGPRTDMPHLTAAFDVAVSSSFGEAFSLAIGEALACGVPCVVTRVGNSARLVEGAGAAVDPGDAAALGAEIVGLIDAGADRREQLGAVGRTRIEREFSLATAVRRYGDLYSEIASQKR
jgi:glycosyltransferase involved in cell wall biosynthesis